MAIVSTDFKFLQVNNAFEKLFEYTQDEIGHGGGIYQDEKMEPMDLIPPMYSFAMIPV